MVVTSDACLAVVYATLAACMWLFGAGTVARVYWCAPRPPARRS
jgi:hypothetical protein